MIKEGDIPVLKNLIATLQKSFNSLKESYQKKDSENFNKAKGELVRTQREILNKINS